MRNEILFSNQDKFLSSIKKIFRGICKTDYYLDVILVSEDYQIEAHLILFSASCLVNFIYCGDKEVLTFAF